MAMKNVDKTSYRRTAVHMKVTACAVLIAFIFSPVSFSYAGDAPALGLNPNGFPEAIVHEEDIADQIEENRLEMEEEELRRELRNDFLSFPDVSPLSPPTDPTDPVRALEDFLEGDQESKKKDAGNDDESISKGEDRREDGRDGRDRHDRGDKSDSDKEEDDIADMDSENSEPNLVELVISTHPFMTVKAGSAPASPSIINGFLSSASDAMGSGISAAIENSTNPSARESGNVLIPPAFFQSALERREEKKEEERSDRKRLADAIEDFFDAKERIRDRNKTEEISLRPFIERVSLLELLVVPIRRFLERDSAPSLPRVISNTPVKAASEGFEVIAHFAGTAGTPSGISNVSSESSFERPLLLSSPNVYASRSANVSGLVVNLVASVAAVTNHPQIIEAAESHFIQQLESLEIEIAQTLAQISDLENTVRVLGKEHQELAQKVKQEADVVRYFLKAVASIRSEITEAALKRILEEAKPKLTTLEGYILTHSLMAYLIHLVRSREIESESRARTEFLRKHVHSKEGLKDLKESLKETAAAVITAEMLKDISQTVREKLLNQLTELEDSYGRLRDALLKMARIHESTSGPAITDIRRKQAYIFDISAKMEDVIGMINDLQTTEREYVGKIKTYTDRLSASMAKLEGVDLSKLPDGVREAAMFLKSRAEKLAIKPADSADHYLFREHYWHSRTERILKAATHIELSATAREHIQVSLLPSLNEQMIKLSGEMAGLAKKVLAEAERAEMAVRKIQSLLSGVEQRCQLMQGYSLEIKSLVEGSLDIAIPAVS